MSRIGKKPIPIVSGVEVKLEGNALTVEGAKGKLSRSFNPMMKIKIERDEILVSRSYDDKENRALQGLTRSLIQNMVVGVSQEFTKEMKVEGIGFKVLVSGKKLQLALGFSHPIDYDIPDGVTVTAPKPTQIVVKGIDRAQVGQVAADIRSFFVPEPYKGKGIQLLGERIRRKKGKAVA